MLEAEDGTRHARAGRNLEGPLGDVLGEVAHTLEVARDADRRHDLAQIHRHRLAPRDGEDGLGFDISLEKVEPHVARHHRLGKLGIEQRESVHGLRQHLLGDAAHLGDLAAERLEFGVVV